MSADTHRAHKALQLSRRAPAFRKPSRRALKGARRNVVGPRVRTRDMVRRGARAHVREPKVVEVLQPFEVLGSEYRGCAEMRLSSMRWPGSRSEAAAAAAVAAGAGRDRLGRAPLPLSAYRPGWRSKPYKHSQRTGAGAPRLPRPARLKESTAALEHRGPEPGPGVAENSLGSPIFLGPDSPDGNGRFFLTAWARDWAWAGPGALPCHRADRADRARKQ